jgi:hypothetical protein
LVEKHVLMTFQLFIGSIDWPTYDFDSLAFVSGKQGSAIPLKGVPNSAIVVLVLRDHVGKGECAGFVFLVS